MARLVVASQGEVLAGLDQVAVTAENLNVPVRVLATEGERLHMVHVHYVREDERSAPRTAGTTTGTDQGTEPSGPREHPDQHRATDPPSTYRSTPFVDLVVPLAAAPVSGRLGAVNTSHAHRLVVVLVLVVACRPLDLNRGTLRPTAPGGWDG